MKRGMQATRRPLLGDEGWAAGSADMLSALDAGMGRRPDSTTARAYLARLFTDVLHAGAGSAWASRGACADSDAVFFGHNPTGAEVCNVCPVWRQCRLTGATEAAGVWGGLSRTAAQPLAELLRRSVCWSCSRPHSKLVPQPRLCQACRKARSLRGADEGAEPGSGTSDWPTAMRGLLARFGGDVASAVASLPTEVASHPLVAAMVE